MIAAHSNIMGDAVSFDAEGEAFHCADRRIIQVHPTRKGETPMRGRVACDRVIRPPRLLNGGVARCALFASCALAVSCRDEPLALRTQPISRNSGLAPAAPSLARVRPEEAGFAALSDRVPSSAGYFIDSLGRFTIWVRDSSERGQAIAATSAEVAAVRARAGAARITGVTTRTAKLTFVQLATWRDIVHEQLFRSHPVVGLDLNEQTNRVLIELDGKLPRQVDHA